MNSYRVEEEGRRQNARSFRKPQEIWYCKWTRITCYAHLITTAASVPLSLLGLLVASLFTVGLALPLLWAFLVLIPAMFLPGFFGLLLVDLVEKTRKE